MRRYSLLIILLSILVGKAAAQSVTVDATIDSLQIPIGGQARITLEVSTDADKRALFPMYPDTLVRGVEVLDVAKPDTQYLNDGKRLLIRQKYTITSFDSALYYLPPMEVRVDTTVYRSKALALKVYSMQVPLDPENPEQFFGSKTVLSPPFVWADWYGTIGGGLLLIPLVFLLIYLIKRVIDHKPIIRKVKVPVKIPPHEQAMQEIDRIKGEKIWQKGRPKEYYTELTDVLRTYIKDRFGFNALEMTSSEIIARLREVGSKDDISDLRTLFQTADLVKFAKHNPLMDENDTNLLNAVAFINDTTLPEDPNAKPQPTEITIVEKRTLRAKIALWAGIALAGAAVLGILIYIGVQLYNGFV